MQNSKLFYRYYDDLYSAKDYRGEVQILLKIAKKAYPGKIAKMIEIGAGTGNHTIEFAKEGLRITAIDTDADMISIAKKKISERYANIRLKNAPVRKINETGFDLAVAGFNVINYLNDLDSLKIFFEEISKRLREDGLLLFDCWNGIAAIKEPPGKKVIRVSGGKKIIHCRVNAHTDLMKQQTTLTYQLRVRDKKSGLAEEGLYRFSQSLFTPVEINYCLNSAGLEVIECCKNFMPANAAGENDWKIMFVCRKRN